MADKDELNISQILGRAGKPLPPEAPAASSPEDYAPKRPPIGVDTRSTLEEAGLAQQLKSEIRQAPQWAMLSQGEKEALDLICTEMSRICFGRDQWDDIIECAYLGKEGNRG